MRRAHRLAIAMAIATGCVACTDAPNTTGPSASTSSTQPESTKSGTSAATAGSLEPGTFQVTTAQAAEIAAVVAFIHAVNNHQFAAAMAQFTTDQPANVGYSDCNYRRGITIQGHGRTAAAGWVQHLINEDTQFTIGTISDSNPSQPIGVLAVTLRHRTSRSIRAAGHPHGITPSLGTKAKFVAAGKLLQFNAGPVGGDGSSCRI